jgi:metal-dependent amidase/aminoacylase/carboxypeptidase family protein
VSAETEIPDFARIHQLRHELHAAPEVSGQEHATAATVAEFVAGYEPTALHTGVGGCGLLAVFAARDAAPTGSDGQPTVVLRAELDALPITERSAGLPYRSQRPGVAHLCGHDGHMAMVAGLAPWLRQRPPTRGRVALLFQPAEETGAGARRVVEDRRYRSLAPRWVFALHNLPGYAEGAVLLKSGPLTAASIGLEIRLQGRTAHAAHPERGCSPAAAVSRLVPRLATLGAGTGDAGSGAAGPGGAEVQGADALALVTVVHIRVGERTFGTAPGQGEILATLRAGDDAGLAALRTAAAAVVQEEAVRDGLAVELAWQDEFPATVNDPAAIALVRRTCRELGILTSVPAESPFRWSEDFGAYLRDTPGALIGLGAGEDHPDLHAPDFDFPDALLPRGLELLARLVELGLDAPL